jgi:hypothetical protein
VDVSLCEGTGQVSLERGTDADCEESIRLLGFHASCAFQFNLCSLTFALFEAD